MNLNTSELIAQRSELAVRSSHYLTDLKIGTDIRVYAYTKVPVFGRLIGWVRHIFISKTVKATLKGQVNQFISTHVNEAKSYLDKAIDNPAFLPQIQRVYQYYQTIRDIASKNYISTPLRSFHDFALIKFNSSVNTKEISDKLNKGELAKLAEIDDLERVSNAIDEYVRVISVPQSIRTKKQEFDRLKRLDDNLVVILNICVNRNIFTGDVNKISALDNDIQKREEDNTTANLVFVEAMQELLPRLKVNYTPLARKVENFCDNVLKKRYEELNQRIADAKDPESIVANIQGLKFSHGVAIQEHLKLLKQIEFWDKFNTLKGSLSINLSKINQNGFFDQLAETHPIKALVLMDKMDSAADKGLAFVKLRLNDDPEFIAAIEKFNK